MLVDIIRKEILENINSPKFVFSFLLVTILILLATFTGINNYRAELREYNAAVALNEKNLENQPSYQALAGIGTKVNRPPQVLGSIVTGIQKAVGRQATVNIVYDPNLINSNYDSNPVLAVFGELDLILIVKIVLSLLAILFTYDAIVGEKERGTLKLSLAARVPRDKLILGKATGGLISLLVPLVIPFILSLLMLNLFPDISLAAGEWMRIGLIFLLFLLYLAVFFTLGLMVSTLTRRSSSSLFVLLFIWVLFIFVLPKSAVILAERLRPIPSVHEITAEKDAFLAEIQAKRQAEAQKWIAAKRNEGPGEEFHEELKAYVEKIQQETTAAIDARNAELENDYQSRRSAQQSLALNLSRISPASSLSIGAMSLAKTGIREQERFMNSIKSYKPVFTRWANEKSIRSLNFKNPGEVTKPDLADMPRHSFQAESLAESLNLALPDIIVMVLMSLVFFSGAFVAFLKYDVR